MAPVLQEMLEAEMTAHLGRTKYERTLLQTHNIHRGSIVLFAVLVFHRVSVLLFTPTGATIT